jgi:hypothetical protein
MSVYGTLDDPAWRTHSVVAGPLVFYSADQYAEQPASLFAPLPGNDGYYAGQKLLVLVRRGAVGTVGREPASWAPSEPQPATRNASTRAVARASSLVMSRIVGGRRNFA